jgi:hypothetical protein
MTATATIILTVIIYAVVTPIVIAGLLAAMLLWATFFLGFPLTYAMVQGAWLRLSAWHEE